MDHGPRGRPVEKSVVEVLPPAAQHRDRPHVRQAAPQVLDGAGQRRHPVERQGEWGLRRDPGVGSRQSQPVPVGRPHRTDGLRRRQTSRHRNEPVGTADVELPAPHPDRKRRLRRRNDHRPETRHRPDRESPRRSRRQQRPTRVLSRVRPRDRPVLSARPDQRRPVRTRRIIPRHHPLAGGGSSLVPDGRVPPVPRRPGRRMESGHELAALQTVP